MIGTTKRFSIYFSEETFVSKGILIVYLEEFEAAGKIILDDQLEKLSFGQNTIQLGFKAVELHQDKELWIH